ncbi:MAG: zinc carboxypeptidase, partial [Sphingobacteriales bacterium]
MKKLFTICLSAIFSVLLAQAQVKSPDEFLGYELGVHFTPHHKVAEYFKQTAAAASNVVKLVEYGKTNEGRPLMVAIVSSAENINKLEKIQKDNLSLAAGTTNAV